MRLEAHRGLVVTVDHGAADGMLEDDETSKAECLRKEVAELQRKRDLHRRRLKDDKVRWQGAKHNLDLELREVKRQLRAREEELDSLENPSHEAAHRLAGPKCAIFIESRAWTTISALVVLVNVTTMFMKRYYPGTVGRHEAVIFCADQFYLGFYCFELLVKAVLMRGRLLCGPPRYVLWHWLDLAIILCGIADQWALPMSIRFELLDSASVPPACSFLQYARLAKLLRVLKALCAFFTSDLSWAAGSRFQLVMGAVILVNAVILAFQVDTPDFEGWFYVDRVLLSVYTFELLVRMKHFGRKFFCRAQKDVMWNWLDFVLVAVGLADMWLVPVSHVVKRVAGREIKTYDQSLLARVARLTMTVRMLRLFRIFRMMRLARHVDPLYTVLGGVRSALQGLLWVLVLTFLFVFVWALFAVVMLGRGLLFGGHPPGDVARTFPTVPDSMFVLFKVMTGDLEDVEPLLEVMPCMKVFVGLFVVVASWAVVSVLTAVASESMITAAGKHRQDREQKEELKKAVDSAHKLEEILAGADGDLGCELSKAEFERLMEDEQRAAGLADASGAGRADLVNLFDMLSDRRAPEEGPERSPASCSVNRRDFAEGLRNVNKTATECTVLRMSKHLHKLERSVAEVEGRLAQDRKQLGEFMDAVNNKLECVQEATSVAQMLARLEQRLDSIEASRAASAASSAKEAAGVAGALQRLEEQMSAGALAAQQAAGAAEAAEAAAKQAVEAASTMELALARSTEAAFAEAPATPEHDSHFMFEDVISAVITKDNSPMLMLAEANDINTTTGFMMGWGPQSLVVGKEEDGPLPVPKPSGGAAGSARGPSRPAGTGEEPIGTVSSSAAAPEVAGDSRCLKEIVDPMEHLLN